MRVYKAVGQGVLITAVTAALTACSSVPGRGAQSSSSGEPFAQIAPPPVAAPAAPSATSAVPSYDPAAFNAWLAAAAAEARTEGISEATIRGVLLRIKPVPKVLVLDQKQPEFTQTFWTYAANATNNDRVAQGRAALTARAALFQAVQARYGVQPSILAAFWGMETGYGKIMGDFSTVDALATLAFEGRRADLFRAEMFAALKLIDSGRTPASQLRGSWAGAFGNMQFMPSSALTYGVDGDGDGRIDLRGSVPDALFSAGNFLQALHWRAGQSWGRQVALPLHFDIGAAGLGNRHAVADWAAAGVTHIDGTPLDTADQAAAAGGAALVLPAGVKGPAFLVFDNFRVIMNWNHSVLYALSVGLLSDRLAGLPPMQGVQPVDDRPLSRNEMIELQTRLANAGYAIGKTDGLAGGQTLEAVKAYQRKHGLPPDGYPDPSLLAAVRQAP